MRVVKVLNNSLILALDDKGEEVILLGKGIGFKKSTGSHLNKEDVEKVFELRDKKISKNIIQLAADTDAVFFELAKTIIDYGKNKYQMKLLDHLYLSLTDHLAYAVKRVREGIHFQNYYTLEMKKFNPNEFDVGRYARSVVLERLNVELPEDEAGNIAFHFINAQQDNPYNSQNQVINSVVRDMLNIVKYSFRVVFDEDSTSYVRCVTHMRLFVQRLLHKEMISDEQNMFLFQQIIESCPREQACVKKIGVYIQERFKTKITTQEEMYLTLHVHQVVSASSREAQSKMEKE